MNASVERTVSAADPAAPSQTLGQRIVLHAVYAVPFLWLIGHLFPPVNHDAAAVLDFSRRWLMGEKLYVDLIDINTPLTFVHYAVPVAMSWLTGLTTPTTLVLWFAIVIAGSAWLCQRLIAQLVPAERALTRSFLIALILFGFVVQPSDEFGQREHLMVLLAMPYVLAAAARAKGIDVGTRPLMLYAALAVAGFAMKPHFAAIPALVEGYLLVVRGLRPSLRDPTPWIVAAGFGLHALFIVFATPDYLRTVVPLAMEYYIDLGTGGVLSVALSRMTSANIVALAVLAAPAFLFDRTRIAPAVLMFAIGGLISNIAQEKGWPYHALPAAVATLVLAGLMIGEALDRLMPRAAQAAHGAREALVVVMMGLCLYVFALDDDPFRKQITYAGSPVAHLAKVVKKHAKGGRVLVLSPGIYPHYPMVNYARATMAMPFMTMWLLQGIYLECDGTEQRYHDPEDMDQAEQFAFNTVARNLANLKPGVVIEDVDPGIAWCPDSGAFSYLDYFLRNPVFAEEWQNYYLVESYERYRVYARLH